MPKFKRTGLYLKNKRIGNSYTQVDISKFLGFSTNSYVSRVESGEVMHSPENLKKLIKLLNMDVELFLKLYGDDICQNAMKKLQQLISQ